MTNISKKSIHELNYLLVQLLRDCEHAIYLVNSCTFLQWKEGAGIKNLGGYNIVEHKGEIYKGNVNYWVSKAALEKIKKQHKTERVCF